MLRISTETFDEIKLFGEHGLDPVTEGKLVKSKLANLLVWKSALIPDIVTDFYHVGGVRSLLSPSAASSKFDAVEQQRLANIWNHFASMKADVEMPVRKQLGSSVSGAGGNCNVQMLPVYSTQTYRDMAMFCQFCNEFGHLTNCCENAIAAEMITLFAGQSPQVQRALLSFLQ